MSQDLSQAAHLRFLSDATRVELWFRSWLNVSGLKEAWDSNFGQNYWFDVVESLTER